MAKDLIVLSSSGQTERGLGYETLDVCKRTLRTEVQIFPGLLRSDSLARSKQFAERMRASRV